MFVLSYFLASISFLLVFVHFAKSYPVTRTVNNLSVEFCWINLRSQPILGGLQIVVAADRVWLVIVCAPVCDFNQSVPGSLICNRAHGAAATLCSIQLLFVGCEAGADLRRLVGSQQVMPHLVLLWRLRQLLLLMQFQTLQLLHHLILWSIGCR